MNNPANILIVRTDRIGDVILSLPMASVIKKHFTDSKLTFLLSSYTKELASANRDIDSILNLKQKNGKIAFLENIRIIRNQKFDVCFVVYPTFKIAMILFFSGIKNRIGSGYRWYSFLFNKRIYEHRKNGREHELEYNIKMLRKIGIDEKVDKNNVNFGIYPQKNNLEKTAAKLVALNIDLRDSFIIIHPGSGGSSVDLPAERLKEIINHINEYYKVTILISGSKEERENCEQFLLSETKYKCQRFIRFGRIYCPDQQIKIFNGKFYWSHSYCRSLRYTRYRLLPENKFVFRC